MIIHMIFSYWYLLLVFMFLRKLLVFIFLKKYLFDWYYDDARSIYFGIEKTKELSEAVNQRPTDKAMTKTKQETNQWSTKHNIEHNQIEKRIPTTDRDALAVLAPTSCTHRATLEITPVTSLLWRDGLAVPARLVASIVLLLSLIHWWFCSKAKIQRQRLRNISSWYYQYFKVIWLQLTVILFVRVFVRQVWIHLALLSFTTYV